MDSYICRNCGSKSANYIYEGEGIISCCPEREPVEIITSSGKDLVWGWKVFAENKTLREREIKIAKGLNWIKDNQQLGVTGACDEMINDLLSKQETK